MTDAFGMLLQVDDGEADVDLRVSLEKQTVIKHGPAETDKQPQVIASDFFWFRFCVSCCDVQSWTARPLLRLAWSISWSICKTCITHGDSGIAPYRIMSFACWRDSLVTLHSNTGGSLQSSIQVGAYDADWNIGHQHRREAEF